MILLSAAGEILAGEHSGGCPLRGRRIVYGFDTASMLAEGTRHPRSKKQTYDWTMDTRSVGGVIIVVGILAVVVGILVATGALSWFGRLPGDLRIQNENSRVFIPITSMIVISLVVSLLLNVLRRWF
jgi:hypothetical protein